MKKLMSILVLLLFTLSGCYSCQSWNDFWGKGEREDFPPGKVFWSKDCKPLGQAAPAKPPPKLRSECGDSSATGYYPCEGCVVVKLEKIMPAEVAINTKFEYTIKVINQADAMLSDVVVTESVPANFTVAGTSPRARAEGGKLIIEIGDLGPGQTKLITIAGMVTNTECMTTCATVSYVIQTCASVKPVQPKLQLQKIAPREVLLCNPIPMKFVVTNSGSGSARNVKIVDTLPAGIKTAEGRSELIFNAGTLAPGQSREFSTTLKASRTGKFVNKAVASSAEGLKAESETTTIIRQPVLTISKSGPQRHFLGRSVTYEITVTNKGDAPAENVVVEDQLPRGIKLVSASNGGRAAAGKIQWKLGTLMPNRSRKVAVKVMPDEAGTLTNVVTATATCAEGVSASVQTSVAGIPAVLLEVIDIDDPVEIGGQTTYVITATNQGSTVGTNISIVCTLEANEQYVSSSGATRGTSEGNIVTFAPLRRLAPQDRATWNVVVKALKPGDVRFKVTMNTDQIDRPVEETEATRLYE